MAGADESERQSSLIGYYDSDAAASAIERLLSAHGVPFRIERATGHWAGTRARLVVTVPAAREREAQALLADAADAGSIERASGADGLVQY
jgi:hypothetical protein